MSIFQEAAIDLSRGSNFIPQKMRYRLPLTKNGTSVYLLSNSFEYDIELIKNMPLPKMDYKNIIIPYRIMDTIGHKPFRYITQMNDFNRRIAYINSKKLIPTVTAVKFPYPKKIETNLYISLSDIIPLITPYIRMYSRQYIQENIFDLFNKVLGFLNFTNDKILIIDTSKYKIYKTPNVSNFLSDLINALLTAYIYNDPDKIKKINLTIIFRAPTMDYKFDLGLFEKRDIPRMRKMLEVIGVESELSAKTNEEADAIMASTFSVEDTDNKIANTEIEEKSDEELAEEPVEDQEVKDMQSRNDNATSSIKDTLNKLSDKYSDQLSAAPKTDTNEVDEANRKLMAVKTMDINAKLINKINPDSNVVSNYKTLSSTLSNTTDGSVEDHILKATTKQMSKHVALSDQDTVMNTISSEREREIREKIGQVKLGNVKFSTLTSITDVPKPAPLKINKITTTNRGAMQGTSFTHIAKEYEDKLLDRDIVATFMNFSKLPDGFYVTDVKVTDISNATSLLNEWKVTLRNKNSDKQSIINIRVPRVINGRFYNNGIWYNIGKQDFPIPILKINKKTVMLTSNYNKITCTRYDTRSLVDLGMLVKVIEKISDESGKNKYTKPGNSSNTNSRFVSTIEYDEYAKRWVHFVNREAQLEIEFNRATCLKKYAFVSVNQNEFCCGMLKQVPIIINTETGKSRNNDTLTDIILKTLPEQLQQTYRSQKPGKMSMYSEITIGVTIPLGVAIAAWEGLNSLLKKSGAAYKFVDSSFKDMNYFTIPFKDKILAVESSISNQLIFNGFYRINTKNYNVADFETPIMNSNSVFVDIFNNLFFKQYSQLTTFVTYYNFFVDAITADVCEHYHIPSDIAGMLIYASNLLADNNCASENNAALYRIRSSEIIPAIIHFRLAFAISKYNNSVGSKSRGNSIAFNPNEVINELLAVPNVEPMSALNPFVELHARENITKKGFKGVNSDRSYTQDKRTYEDTMVGKMALSSPNNGTVGVTRQLVADPKITSVRGYTSTQGIDTDFNDLQLASFSELLTPGTVTRDDAIRTAIATSQTSHIVSTRGAQPVLISNGVDELVPAYLTEEFSYVAVEDGQVLEIADDYIILQYKSGTKKAVYIGHTPSFNSGSGFYVDNHLNSNVEAGQKFKKGDIIAYHDKFFTKDIDGTVRMNIGPLAKVAFAGLYSTYEDAGLITEKMSKLLETSLMMKQEQKLNAFDDIESVVKVGTEVEIGDPLIVFGLGDTGDKSVDNFLKAFQTKETNDILDNAKRIIRSKHAGKVVAINMYTTKSLDKLSPSLFTLLNDHFKENLRRRKILDKYDKTDSVFKMGTLYGAPTEPLKGTTIKGQTCDVMIEIYIEHADEASVGDKLAIYGASKQVLSEVVPLGMEPYTETNPDEEVSLFVTPSAILKRMIPSLLVTASGNKVLVELKRKMKRIWDGKE